MNCYSNDFNMLFKNRETAASFAAILRCRGRRYRGGGLKKDRADAASSRDLFSRDVPHRKVLRWSVHDRLTAPESVWNNSHTAQGRSPDLS